MATAATCPRCGRTLRPNTYARHLATHEPGHAEARRERKAAHMRRYHRSPAGQATYRRTQVDTCSCGRPKATKAATCRACQVPAMPERFWSKVDTSAGLFECWPWTGGSDEHGRGTFRLDGRVRNAPAVALELALGRVLQPGMSALHTCDNPPCCNPAHLYEGTQQQNIADMVARGRHRSQVGV